MPSPFPTPSLPSHRAARAQAATCLRDLSANPTFKLKIVEAGGVRAAISLMKSEDSLALRSMGMCTLRYLSLKPIIKPKVVQAGGLPAACLLANHNVTSPLAMDLQTHVAGFLVSMAERMESHLTMVASGAFEVRGWARAVACRRLCVFALCAWVVCRVCCARGWPCGFGASAPCLCPVCVPGAAHSGCVCMCM